MSSIWLSKGFVTTTEIGVVFPAENGEMRLFIAEAEVGVEGDEFTEANEADKRRLRARIAAAVLERWDVLVGRYGAVEIWETDLARRRWIVGVADMADKKLLLLLLLFMLLFPVDISIVGIAETDVLSTEPEKNGWGLESTGVNNDKFANTPPRLFVSKELNVEFALFVSNDNPFMSWNEEESIPKSTDPKNEEFDSREDDSEESLDCGSFSKFEKSNSSVLKVVSSIDCASSSVGERRNEVS